MEQLADVGMVQAFLPCSESSGLVILGLDGNPANRFCTLYQYTSQLKTYMNTLEAVSFSKLDSAEGKDPRAGAAIKSIWELALSGE